MHYTFQIERAIFPACRRICKEAEEGAREGEDECEGGMGVLEKRGCNLTTPQFLHALWLQTEMIPSLPLCPLNMQEEHRLKFTFTLKLLE